MEFNATFIVTTISFIVFVFIMNAILYRPLEKIVDERKQFIDDTNLIAQKNFDESEKILEEKNKKIAQTKQQAKNLIAEKSDFAKQTKYEIQSEAQRVSFEKIQDANQELIKSKEEASNVLSDSINVLAGEISSKILG